MKIFLKNIGAGRLAGIAMLHNSTSTFGVCSQPRRHSFARTKSGTGLCQDYCICIIRDCVPRNFCPTYESENSVCPPCRPDLTVFLPPSPPRSRPPSSSSRNSTRVTLHLAPVSRVVGSYSQRFERTRDTASPFLSFPSALSCPDLPLFIRSLQGRKRIVEASRVDRPAIAWQLFDPRPEKSMFALDTFAMFSGYFWDSLLLSIHLSLFFG